MSIKIQRPEERDYAGRGAVLRRVCELPRGEEDLVRIEGSFIILYY